MYEKQRWLMENKRETTLVDTQTSRAQNTEHTEETTQRLMPCMATNPCQQSRDIRNQDGVIIRTPAQEHKKGKEEPEERSRLSHALTTRR